LTWYSDISASPVGTTFSQAEFAFRPHRAGSKPGRMNEVDPDR